MPTESHADMLKQAAMLSAGALHGLGALRALEMIDSSADSLRVLAYHRVDDPDAAPDLDPGLVSATPGEFAAQMDLLARCYHPISLDMLVDALATGEPLPPRAVLLTFDDGYLDFAEHAWPVMRERGISPVLFVPTAFPDAGQGRGFWWDRLHASLRRSEHAQVQLTTPSGAMLTLRLGDASARREAFRQLRNVVKALPHGDAMAWLDSILEQLSAPLPPLHHVLGWEALRKLAREGVSVCPHSHEHALLTRLDDTALADDLATSRKLFAQHLGEHGDLRAMAYPANATDETVRSAVARAGFTVAFGGRRGICRPASADALDLMRLPALRYPLPLFRAQLRPSVSRVARLVDRARSRTRTRTPGQVEPA